MTAVVVEPRDLSGLARQWLDDPDVDLTPPAAPAEVADVLAHRDAQVSRCGRCGEWRYRAALAPCQTCRAPRVP